MSDAADVRGGGDHNGIRVSIVMVCMRGACACACACHCVGLLLLSVCGIDASLFAIVVRWRSPLSMACFLAETTEW